VMVFEEIPAASSGPIGFSPPDFAFFERQQNRTLAEIAAFSNRTYELSGVDEAERLIGARVSPGLFPLLGVQPALGRNFTRPENEPGHNVVILSHGLWRRKFGGDSAMIGRVVTLDRQPYTVVGIMPAGFEFPHRGPVGNNQPAELWVPIAFAPWELRAWTSMYNHSVLARLNPGVTLEQARGEVKAMVSRLEEAYPAAARLDLDATVQSFRTEVIGRTQTLLLVLMAAVGMVLLIACADVANLLLTRAGERQPEMAVRTALGAGRMRLVRQLFTESLLLALTGGVLGLTLAALSTDLLVRFSPVSLPRATEISIDSRVLGFALLLCLGTAVVFGLAPAWEAARGDIGEVLKEGGRRSTPGRRRRLLLSALVVSQFALALVLLIGAGLLARSFVSLLATHPGFRPERVLSMSVSLPGRSYSKAGQIRNFYRSLIERVEALPGVHAVAAATDLPLVVRERRGFTPDVEVASGIPRVIAHVWVLGDYFEALGIQLKKGRFFTRQDGQTGERVIIINETMARRFWPGQDPVGRRMKWGGTNSQAPWMTIVGVMADVKHGPLQTETIPQTVEPYLQVGDAMVSLLSSLTLVVRTDVDPTRLIAAVRQEIRALDAALPVANIQTLEQHVHKSVAPQRFNTFLLAIFALLALILAAIGIYGIMARSVTRRTHEIGVRMALGAQRKDVLRLVVRQGMLLAFLGMATGMAAALAVTRVLSSFLYNVEPRDPLTFAGVAVLLGLVALLACYLPARRATRVDPVIALRYE
jgi:putative ABC transport system permease protein